MAGGTIVGATHEQLLWSPDGKQVVAVGVLVKEGTLGLAGWEVATGKRFYSFAATGDDGPRAAAFTADSKAIAVGYKNHVDIWSGGIGPPRKLPTGEVTALAFPPDDKLLAVAIRKPILNPADNPPAMLGHKTEVQVLNVETGKELHRLDGFEGVGHTAPTALPVVALAFSPDGKLLLAGTGPPAFAPVPNDLPKTGEVRVFDLSPPPAEVPADRFVSFFNERAELLSNIEYGDISARISGKGMSPTTLHGSFAASQPKSFRLVADHRIADVKVDMGSNEREFWLYLSSPASEPLYVFASHADMADGKAKMPEGVFFESSWVLELIGMAKLPADADYRTTINARERTYTLSWKSRIANGISVQRELVFDADAATGTRPQVRKHVIRSAKTNAEIASAEILAAQIVSDKNRLAFQYPRRVVLKWAESPFEIDLTLDKAVTNAQMAGDASRRGLFTQPTVKNVTPIDLAGRRTK